MSPPPPREPSALRVVRGYEHAYPAIDQRQAYDRAGDLGDHLQTSLVAERHGVHMAPGHATPAGVALHRQPEWDAGDGVFREAHGVPLYGRVPAPDPHGIATVDGDRVIEWGLPPITAGGREQSTCEDGAAHSVVYPTPSRKGYFGDRREAQKWPAAFGTRCPAESMSIPMPVSSRQVPRMPAGPIAVTTKSSPVPSNPSYSPNRSHWYCQMTPG